MTHTIFTLFFVHRNNNTWLQSIHHGFHLFRLIEEERLRLFILVGGIVYGVVEEQEGIVYDLAHVGSSVTPAQRGEIVIG